MSNERKTKKPAKDKPEREDLDQPKSDQERIRTKHSRETQPEDAMSEENVERGAPRHRN